MEDETPAVQWINSLTGEIADDCPYCETVRRDAEIQVHHLELEMRKMRARVTRAENAVANAELSKRDGKVWKAALSKWMETFPEKRVTSKGIKSERATVFFQRLEAGAGPEDVDVAIEAASEWRFIVYGKRQKSGSQSDLAIDLIHICKGDAQFDFLVEKGRELRADKDPLF